MKRLSPGGGGGGGADKGAGKRLLSGVALPALSVLDFGFDLGACARVAVESALTGCPPPREVEVVFCVEPGAQEEAFSSALSAAAPVLSPSPPRKGGVRLVAKGSFLEAAKQASCRYIVCPCSWQIARGCRVCRDVHDTLGPQLAELCLRSHGGTAQVGVPLPVRVGQLSDEFDAIVFMRGPNLNPSRPDHMLDRRAAEAALRQCYHSALLCSYQLIAADSGRRRRAETERAEADLSLQFASYCPPVCLPPRSRDWSRVLYMYLGPSTNRQRELESNIYYEDASVCVIYDAYPKAKYHLLMLPKNLDSDVHGGGRLVETPNDLRLHHVEALRRLHRTGFAICSHLASKCESEGHEFVLGYHSLPSLKPLHIHLISTDFDSECLKTKKHWNSFTTPFFLQASDVESELQEQGRLSLDASACRELLNGPMSCVMCGVKLPGIPSLKKHITDCKNDVIPIATHARICG